MSLPYYLLYYFLNNSGKIDFLNKKDIHDDIYILRRNSISYLADLKELHKNGFGISEVYEKLETMIFFSDLESLSILISSPFPHAQIISVTGKAVKRAKN